MRGFLDCQPCFLKQALATTRRVTDSEEVQARVLKRVLEILSRLDYRLPPPLIAHSVYRAISEVTECADPYREIKERSNRIALDFYTWARETVEKSDSPLDTAMRLAIAANVVDFGIDVKFDLKESLMNVLERGLDVDESGAFKEALSAAGTLLYIGDNAGEIVFDKLFLELIARFHPSLIKTFAVRGGAAINDVTLLDAESVRMDEVAAVVSTGFAAPGTIIKRSSKEFQSLFRRSDLIIAKGQGNYESLSLEENGNIFFLLRAKCHVIARDLNVPIGSFILMKNRGVNS